MAERRVVVHSLDHARAALRAAEAHGVAVTLLSGPGAAGYAGPAWFRELIAAATAEHPQARVKAVLDCGDAAGHAMAALRAGLKAIRFQGDPAVADRIAELAQGYGAVVEPSRGAALDLAETVDPEAACHAWLGGPMGRS
ncbi:MAG: hypothetical protein ACE5JZ_12070 [Kiloniellales bacterium]